MNLSLTLFQLNFFFLQKRTYSNGVLGYNGVLERIQFTCYDPIPVLNNDLIHNSIAFTHMEREVICP